MITIIESLCQSYQLIFFSDVHAWSLPSTSNDHLEHLSKEGSVNVILFRVEDEDSFRGSCRKDPVKGTLFSVPRDGSSGYLLRSESRSER
ncbi:hypothetical protein JTE90_003828 [Oedothorax gibbosus]|uniref:Uncharacterized protein n=1 Tax=Oedothorax gibbosus TaxID=931172 RepID=A0AAV6VJ87_9ARAC|nr:hypothetical protein JTE90_003828 [Oedothorax gibbosus]